MIFKILIKKLHTISQFLGLFTIIGFSIQNLLRKKQWRALIDKTPEMGLRYQESDEINGFGIVKGKRNGYELTLTIDASGTNRTGTYISCNSSALIPKLELNQRTPFYKSNEGNIDFKMDSKNFNYIFKTKKADPKTFERLKQNPDLINHIVNFYKTWIIRINSLEIESRGGNYVQFLVRLNYGGPFTAYIPPSETDKIFNDLSSLVKDFDRVLK